VFCNLAYAKVETGDLAAAQSDLGTCRKWAKTEPELRRVSELAAMVAARSKPAAGVQAGEKVRRVTGTARSLECTSGNAGPARLHIVSGTHEVMFDVPEAAAVEVVRTQQADTGFALRCGPLRPVPLTVEYAAPLSSSVSAGIARRVEY
jgi:hypothetical protein